MLDWLAAFARGASVYLKFDNSNSGVKTSAKSVFKQKTKTENSNNVSSSGNTTTETSNESNTTNIYNAPVTILQVTGKLGIPLSPETRLQLQPLLEAYEKGEAAFIADEPKKLLSDVFEHENDPLVRGLLKFFKPKVNARDYQLMRTGLYLKFLRESERKGEAFKLWKRLSDYSSREKTIINLASAGYYHTYFRPLYKELLKGNNPEKKFSKAYESILDDVTFAIFVHAKMGAKEIVDKVTQKAIKNIRYGVKTETISLHGTGASCISTINEAVDMLKPKFPATKTKTISKGLPIVTVAIEYRTNNLKPEDFEHPSVFLS